MKKHQLILYTVLFAAAMVGCNPDKPGDDPGKEDPQQTGYVNPISNLRLPDCSIIRDNGTFYLVASDEAYNGMPIAKSTDLVNWSKVGEVFTATTRPKWDGKAGAGLWAPDITKIGNKYVLYYAYVPDINNEWQWGIGVATADRPTGPWSDKGKVFTGGEIGVRCSIDPCFYSDNGKNYLVWGSYYGIWATELTEDGLAVKSLESKQRLAGADGYGLEGAMILKKDGYYYLFVSEGGTGYNENYKLGAARSQSFLGPYVNKAGQDVTAHGVDFFLRAGNGFVSPGHCSQIITDDHGDDWVLYHAFVNGEEDKGRRLMLSRLTWSGGWPSIDGGVPAKESSVAPYWK